MFLQDASPCTALFKQRQDIRIDLSAGCHIIQNKQGFSERHRLFIRPVFCGQGFKNIQNGDQPCLRRNIFVGDMLRITFSVQEFVML